MDSIIKQILDFKKEDIPDYEKYLMLGGGTPGVNLQRGENVYVYDLEGRKYIDCTSQSWALHLGYAHPEINQVIKEQIDISNHFHTGFYTIPRYILAKKIASLFRKNEQGFVHNRRWRCNRSGSQSCDNKQTLCTQFYFFIRWISWYLFYDNRSFPYRDNG